MQAALDLDARDSGCRAACAALERYVEAEMLGHESGAWFEEIGVHLSRCPACRADHDGLLAVIEHEGDGQRGVTSGRVPDS